MVESDYEYMEDGSDDEYLGSKAQAASSRAQAGGLGSGKRRAPDKPQKLQAWQTERSLTVTLPPVMETDDGSIQQSVQEREEERKRKRSVLLIGARHNVDYLAQSADACLFIGCGKIRNHSSEASYGMLFSSSTYLR